MPKLTEHVVYDQLVDMWNAANEKDPEAAGLGAMLFAGAVVAQLDKETVAAFYNLVTRMKVAIYDN